MPAIALVAAGARLGLSLGKIFGGHGFDSHDCIVGLCIASVKASLVAAIFMHLNHEKKAIYWIFFGSFVFVFFLAWLLKLAHGSPIFDQFFYR